MLMIACLIYPFVISFTASKLTDSDLEFGMVLIVACLSCLLTLLSIAGKWSDSDLGILNGTDYLSDLPPFFFIYSW